MLISKMLEEIIFFSELGDYNKAEKEINMKLENVEENSSVNVILKTFYPDFWRDKGRNNEAMELLTTLNKISKAINYFEEFAKNEKSDFKLIVFAVRYICEYLIIELKNNNLDEIFTVLTSYIRKFKELGSNAPSHSVLVEVLILEAKIIFNTDEINEANKILNSAKKIALDHGVLALAQSVEKEQSLFNSRILNITKMLEADATKYELLSEVEMEDYTDEINKILDL